MSRAGVHEFGALQARLWDTMVDKSVHICVCTHIYIYTYMRIWNIQVPLKRDT